MKNHSPESNRHRDLLGAAPDWDIAQAARPAGPLPFLDPRQIPLCREAVGMPADYDAPLLAVAAEVRNNNGLAALAWYLHWRIFIGPERRKPSPPDLESRLGQRTGAFFLLVALEFAPALKALYQTRGYPDDLLPDGLLQIRENAEVYQRDVGVPGCYGSQLCWLRTYFDFAYVRLGRLAFQLRPLTAPLEVWRRQSDGTVVALAGNGLSVTALGLMAPPDTRPAWITSLSQTGSSVCGSPIHPRGTMEKQSLTLELAQWNPLLSEGDSVLSIHIPPGGGMNLSLVEDALQRALAFFSRYHLETPPRAFWCATWFLDPQLRTLLPSSANILRLQRCLYLHPGPPSADGGLRFVFPDPQKRPLPRDTSLRKAVARFLAAGGQWHGGCGFLPVEDAGPLRENRWTTAFDAFLAGDDASGRTGPAPAGVTLPTGTQPPST